MREVLERGVAQAAEAAEGLSGTRVVSCAGPKSPVNRMASLCAASLLSLAFGGCLFGEDLPSVRKPAFLSPETDTFSESLLRTYSVTEGIERGKRDTTLRAESLVLTRVGDSLAFGDTLVRIQFSSMHGAAAEAGQFGLNPARLLLDSAHAIDPGPALRFPSVPVMGWRLDTTVGDLRFVRTLIDIQTVRSLGKNMQCWVFAESTYWGGHSIAYGKYWMGKTGLVRHRREWKSYQPGDGIGGGILWREIKAIQN